MTEGRGADVIFDPVGGDVFDESLRSIAPDGRIVVIGFASGRIPVIPANLVLLKNCAVVGVSQSAFSRSGKLSPLRCCHFRLSFGLPAYLSPLEITCTDNPKFCSRRSIAGISV
jgi:threonine dehydrogenase-like Zn-dependent dehydrogenase